MRISTFFFLTRRGLRNLGKHLATMMKIPSSSQASMNDGS